jgi:hypothetical protein
MDKITISIFLAILFLVPIVSSLQEKIFFLDITIFKNDTVMLNKFDIIEGVQDRFLPEQSNKDYILKIISSSNQVLFEINLPVFFIAFPDINEEIAEGSPPTKFDMDEVKLILKLPYFSDADKIQIYHSDKLIFDYKIPKPRKPICGNNICETNLGENSNNCPQDCLTTKLPPKPKTPTYVYIIIILVIFVIIALFLYKIRIVKVKQANF